MKKIFKYSKALYASTPYKKRLILLNQMSNMSHYCRIMGNEMSIKVGKSKKTLNILNKSQGSLINNGLDLTRVHENVISRNDVVQEFHFRLIEFTFLQIGIKFNFLKLLQHKTYMVFMICHVL